MKRSLLLVISLFALSALNACGGGASGGNVQPLTITSGAPPSGGAQTAYGVTKSGFSLAASGGVPPYTWSLAASGLISGTPTSSGNYNVQVTVKDSASPPSQQTANYTINISGSTITITSSAPPSGTFG